MFNKNIEDESLNKMDRVDIASFILQCQNYLNDITYENFIRSELKKIHQEMQEIKDLLQKEGGDGTKC